MGHRPPRNWVLRYVRVRYVLTVAAWGLCVLVLPRLYFSRRTLDMYEMILAAVLLMVTAFLTLYVVLDRDNSRDHD